MVAQRGQLLGRSSHWIIALVAALTLGSGSALSQSQAPPPQGAEQSAEAVYSAAELDKLVAPVALYPDALLAQVFPASAYPIDIVQAQRWLDKNKAAVGKQDYSGVDAQSWDPAVKALARFPDVIRKMSEDLDWTTDLGDAFVNQPKDVADAVQRMRAKAATAGSLKTTPQQKVVKRKENNNDVIIIESASPEVIYVPSYNPVQVYDPAAGLVAASLLTFGTAVAIGSMWNNNYWNWGSGVVYPPVWPGYPAWRPPYPGWRPGQPVYPGGRPPGNINIGNEINIGNGSNIGNNVRPWRPDGDRYRPGQGSKPGLRPENRPGGRPGEGQAGRPGDRPGIGPGERPGAGTGAGPVNRPGGNPPGAGAVQRPGDRPGAGSGAVQRPGQGAGGAQRPETRPATRPETRPATRPETRPAPRPQVHPSPARPGGAFGGVDAGRGPAQAFSNRGAQSFNRGPAVGGGGRGGISQGGGGRSGFGGGGGGGGGRGGGRR
ncbi:MAG: DUF3300 domain-containing protein [Beijerinckiaceae bacterium]